MNVQRQLHPEARVVVLIADDQVTRREAIRTLLAREGITIAAETDNAAGAEKLAASLKPDITVLALSIFQGSRTVTKIHDRNSGTRILVLTERLLPDEAVSCIIAGASGVLSTQDMGAVLVNAVRAVAAGEMWAGRKVLGRVVERLRTRAPALDGVSPSVRTRLTTREMVVAELVAHGYSNQEIADRLGRSEKTVKNHLTNIFQKLGCRNRVKLASLLVRGLA